MCAVLSDQETGVIGKAANALAGPGSFAVLFDRQGIRIAHTYSDEIVFHPGGVLDPAGPGGSGRVLPRLWDTAVDRAYRDGRVELAENGVVLLTGALLLGRGLPAELTVHLRMSAAALARRLDPGLAWTLPAYARYDAEHDPGGADVLVLADDPARPALVQR